MLAWREEIAGVGFAFTDRHGGVSAASYASLNLGARVGDAPDAVAENRRRVAAALGVPVDALTLMRQVHGAAVAVIPPARVGADDPVEPVEPVQPHEPVEADGMVTATAGRALVVLAADCIPVLLADPVARVVGVAHAGRKGLAAGVVPATVAAMTVAGARPDGLLARVGPGVCGGCYEVPADMRAEVAAAVPAAAATSRGGRPALDIPAGVLAQLADAGVRRVHRLAVCPRESPDLFSHRRDGRTGRQAGIAWLLP